MQRSLNEEDSMVREKASTMRELVFAVGGPLRSGESRERWLDRVARVAGITRRSAAAAYRRESMSENHRAGVEAKLRAVAGQEEANDLAKRFEGLAQALHVGDADFHSDTIAALVSAARVLRGLDRSGNNGKD
jgi:hypothetical protein